MVVFVILHYMALEETILCVNSIQKNVKGEKKIIVVDNASPNGSLHGLKLAYDANPDIDIIASPENTGFAKGNNLGYAYAVSQYSPEFVAVMNNDMEITQADFIDKIQECYADYSFSIMGPDIYSTKKGYHQNPQTRELPSLAQLKKDHRALWIKDKAKFAIRIKWWIKDRLGRSNKSVQKSNTADYVKDVVINPMLHGSCYIFSKDFIRNHPQECFYNKTFMYMEAEILYYQAIRDGEKMVYCPSLHVDHHEDVATDAEFKKQFAKSVFSVKCLLQSTGAFIELMKADGVK